MINIFVRIHIPLSSDILYLHTARSNMGKSGVASERHVSLGEPRHVQEMVVRCIVFRDVRNTTHLLTC